MVHKDYTYCLYIESPEGRETILEGEKDPRRVRRVATGRKFSKRLRRGFRKAFITRDGKVMQNGRFALDKLCLEMWLEENQPDEVEDHS